MADRKASVALELKAGQFKAEATVVEGKVEGVDRKVKELDRSITKIPPDAAKASVALKLLGDESGKTGVKINDLNKPNSLGALESRLVSARAEVRRLGEEFNRTGSAGSLMGMFNAQRDVKDLESLKKRLTNALGDAGKTGGQEFTKNISAAVQGATSTPGVGPILVGTLIGAAVAASPFLIAAINGALGAGVGLGGLALGIVGQIHDPAVHTALVGFGRGFMTELTRDTASFKQPLINALSTVGDALKGVLGSIDFSGLASALGPLSRGIAGMFTNMNLSAAFAAAVPLVNELARDLPQLGQAIGMMFDQMAKGGQGAKEGLRALLMLLGGLLVEVGFLIRVFSDFYSGLVAFADGVTGFYQKVAHGMAAFLPFLGFLERAATKVHEVWVEIHSGTDPVETLGRSLKDTGSAAALSADDFAAFSSAIDSTAQTADVLAGKIVGKLFGAMMSLDQATLSVNTSLTQVTESIKQNGKSLDEHTAKGQANVGAILGAVSANMALYQAQIASGVSSMDAAKAYDANTAALEAQLHKAHLTQAEIDGLIGKYRNVPDKVNTDIATRGLSDAINNLGNLIAKVNGLDGRSFGFTVIENFEIRQRINAPGNFGHLATGGIRKAQTGLIIPPSDPGTVLVGEPQTGGEVLIPMRGARDPVGLMRTAGAGYGLDVVPRGWGMGGGGRANVTNVNVTVNAGMGTDGYQVGRQVADALRPFVERSGGSVQQAVMRRS